MPNERNDRRTITDLPRLLADARFMKGLTLAEAGAEIGIVASTLMRWERGLGNPSFDQLDRAALWLGLEITLAPKSLARLDAQTPPSEEQT